jgi:tetratricopeptide (TPR) repeat protein
MRRISSILESSKIKTSVLVSVITLCGVTTLLFSGCTSFQHQTRETDPHALVIIKQFRGHQVQRMVTHFDGQLVQPHREYRVTPGEHQLIITEIVPVSGSSAMNKIGEVPGESGTKITLSYLNLSHTTSRALNITNSIIVESGWRYALEGMLVHKTNLSDVTPETADDVREIDPVPTSPDSKSITPLQQAAPLDTPVSKERPDLDNPKVLREVVKGALNRNRIESRGNPMLFYKVGAAVTYTGWVKSRSGTGSLQSLTHYRGGLPNGQMLLWHENGQKKGAYLYEGGALHGPYMDWYQNGVKAEEGNFVFGMPLGLTKRWHKNGKKVGEVENKNNNDESIHLRMVSDLSKIAASKRSAVFLLSTLNINSSGVFISEDGLALVHLQALALQEKPVVLLSDGTTLEMGPILGIFPEQELALLKLDHSPKLWLELASVEPEINETIALVPLNNQSPWNKTTPPVVGQVMAKRSGRAANLRDGQFVKILSLGARLSSAQWSVLGPGNFAVNQEGELVAFTAGTSLGPQTLIFLAPIVDLGNQIADLVEEGKDIGLPLPEAINPMDLASMDRDFHPHNMARSRGDWAEFQRLIEGLYKRYPQSSLIRANLVHLADPRIQNQLPRKFDVNALLKMLEVDPTEIPAQQASCLSTKGEILMMQERFDDAIRFFKEAIALSPVDYPKDRLQLAMLYALSDKPAEAEEVAQALYVHNSEDINVVNLLGFTLMPQGKFDQDPELKKRIAELRKIYGIR